ncbi:MAG TPA: ABC transporter substrate-binding protein [Usitatibacter sp.]|jgi:ABC-type transport system substrate-binding protein|nr:ABC transporter substrate-binding protein [Usitatibacter sp.]
MISFLARVAALIASALVASAAPAPAAPPLKVLHAAFLIAETNFDPAATSDLYSNAIIEEILEPPLTYDFLARPAKLKPLTAEALPEITDGGRTYTLRIRKGIYFADDPAFDGRKRELTAKDYEFAFKRLIDPKLRSPNLWLIEGLAGVKEAEAKASREGRFDYDAPIAGIEVLDRYTLRFHLVKPDYTFVYVLAMETVGAQAREVAERYGDDIGAHPVGTGPFRLAEWKRSSRIVLEKNPNFRELYYEAEPPADDPLSQQLYAEMKGKRLPCVDRVEVSIIEESQPRWLAFLGGEIDWVNLPYEFESMGLPNRELAPWLAKRGVRYMPDLDASVTYLYFNMKDATVGGYTPEKVALRRAISLAYNTGEEVNLLRSGTALEAQMLPAPGVIGYDPDFNLGATYDPARAKALLDMYGYVDRNGDGWRDMPDGSPLVFRYAATPSQLDRQFTELWKKDMDAVGIRMVAEVAKWPDLRKKSKAGLLQTWALGWNADYPDAMDFYQLLYGPNCGVSNDGCFQLPEFDALYDQASHMKQGPERAAVFRKMDRIVAAYAPLKLGTYRKRDELVQPWILGWRKHPILHESFEYADIDLARRAAAGR